MSTRNEEVSAVKTFTAWINYYLEQAGYDPIQDLRSDLRDGLVLAKLLQIITAETPTGLVAKPKLKIQMIENANSVLRFMKEKRVHLVNISAEDIVDGNTKYLLAMCWALARKYQVRLGLEKAKEVDEDEEQNNEIQEVDREENNHGTVTDEDNQIKLMLLSFVQEISEVPVKDFRDSFRDGVVISKFIENLIRMMKKVSIDLTEEDTSKPNSLKIGNALQAAYEHLKIPSLVDPIDMSNGDISEQSMMLYISLFKNMYDAYQEQIQSEEVSLFTDDIPLPTDDIPLPTDVPSTDTTEVSPDSFPDPADIDDYTDSIPTSSTSSSNTPVKENQPLGGEWENGYYVIGKQIRYEPSDKQSIEDDETEKDGSSTVNRTTSQVTSTPSKKGLFEKGFSLTKRIVKEAKHEFDKNIYMDAHSQIRFNRRFRFVASEPLYMEVPCKFASGKTMMLIGNAYITKNFFCFTGSLNSKGLSVILPLIAITEIQPAVAGLLERYKKLPKITPVSSLGPDAVPNALLIHDSRQQIHRFYSIYDVQRFRSCLELIRQQALTGQSNSTHSTTQQPQMPSVYHTGLSTTVPPLPARTPSTQIPALPPRRTQSTSIPTNLSTSVTVPPLPPRRSNTKPTTNF
jgi:hypothetical protein